MSTQTPVNVDASKWGVVLLNMGGPGKASEVKPFLEALLSDPAVMGIPIGFLRRMLARRIARKRAPKVIPRYAAIGGGSPILPQTQAQARALQAALAQDDIPVEIAMRYTKPRARDAVDRLIEIGVTHVVALPLYPQACGATSVTSLEEFESLAHRRQLTVVEVGGYPELDGFIDAISEHMSVSLPFMNDPIVIFTAHGLPIKQVQAGDPYPEQVNKTVQALAKRLPSGTPYRLAFQSRLGPVKWMEPYLDKTVREIAKDGQHDIVVVPVSFVSEHIETLHELDIELRQIAEEAGPRRFERIRTVGTNPSFIAGLADLVYKAIENASMEAAS